MCNVSEYVFLSVLGVMALTLTGCGSGGHTPSPPPGPKCGNRCAVTPSGWPATKEFSVAIKTHDMVYISGMNGFDMTANTMVPGGIKAETRQALQNVATVATAAGTSMDKIVSCTVFMVNITGDFTAMNEQYQDFFPKDPPSRTTVQVTALAKGAVVEIQCIAAAQGSAHSVVPMELPPNVTNMTLPLSVAATSANFVFASGVQGRDGMEIVQGGTQNQTTTAFKSLEATLFKAGSNMKSIVDCTFFLRSTRGWVGDVGEVAIAYQKIWHAMDSSTPGGFPAKMIVASKLSGDANVEITCMAVKRDVAPPKAVMMPWKGKLPSNFPTTWAKTAEGMIFSSGIQGWNTTTMQLVGEGVDVQTTQALKNMEEVFKEAGADFATNAVECKAFLVDMQDYDAMNKAYTAFWQNSSSKTPPPARTAVWVNGLTEDGNHRVEFKCTGVLSASADVEGSEQIII